jgi:hypothetical protein
VKATSAERARSPLLLKLLLSFHISRDRRLIAGPTAKSSRAAASS